MRPASYAEHAVKKSLVLISILMLAALAGCARRTEPPVPEPAVEAVPTPRITIAPTPEPTAAPTQTPVPTATPAPTPFAFLWVTDTQNLAEHEGGYEKLGEWCEEQIGPRNLVYLFGTGDFVNTFHLEAQWDEFEAFMNHFRGGRLPWIMIAGNHDIRLKTMEYEIGTKRLVPEDDIPEQSFGNGKGRYALFEAGGIRWIALGLSYAYGESEIAWADSVLDQYPDRVAVLLFHDYMLFSKKLAKNARDFEKAVIADHPNVRLILCGHNHGSKMNTTYPWGEEGHFVQTILCNKQSLDSMRGAVAIVTVDPVKGTLDLYYSSPLVPACVPVERHMPLDLVLD